jgi:hypothetical protein
MEDMTRTAPWHSLRQNIHHNDTDCDDGRSVKEGDRRDGTGGKPLCERCAQLSREKGRPS